MDFLQLLFLRISVLFFLKNELFHDVVFDAVSVFLRCHSFGFLEVPVESAPVVMTYPVHDFVYGEF